MNQHKKHTHTTTNLMYNNDDKREEREEVMLNGCKESAKQTYSIILENMAN